MKLCAIVPVWNGRDLLARLLTSLEAQTQPASEILVIDNGSTDGAPEMAKDRGARVIAMGRNTGFAPAVNRGICESRADWVAVLNSDVELAPDYFSALLGAGAPFATGRILMANAPERVDGTFDAVCRGGVAWRVGHGRRDGPQFAQRRPIWSPPWTAVLFRSDVFQRVGLLNEAFESYYEDVEFGLRCARQGISGFYVPEAVAWHRGSAALGRWHPDTVRRIARNQCYLVRLHFPFRCAWAVLVAQLLWGLVAARHGTALAWLCGKWQGLRQRPGVRDAAGLDAILAENERTVYHLQKTTGFDPYWRWYFRMTWRRE